MPPAAFYEKSWLRFPEKVAVGSERQSGSFLEQDSTTVPNFTNRSFCPAGILLGLPPQARLFAAYAA